MSLIGCEEGRGPSRVSLPPGCRTAATAGESAAVGRRCGWLRRLVVQKLGRLPPPPLKSFLNKSKDVMRTVLFVGPP